jgi:hypothetical protein
MIICRTLHEVSAAAQADARDDPPLTQDQAGLVAAILWSWRALLQAPPSSVSAPVSPRATRGPWRG